MLAARCTTAFFVTLAFVGASIVHGQAPGNTNPIIKAVLKEASQIVIRQDEHQGYWCDRSLTDIGDVQIRASDFDGALQTISKAIMVMVESRHYCPS
jgi:hypothetical protein